MASIPTKTMAALNAMEAIGIPMQTAKSVMQNLLKVYDDNWEYIEAENYRVLADAILDMQESESKDMGEMGKNDVASNEPEPLKKRTRNRKGADDPGPGVISSDAAAESSLKMPKLEEHVPSEAYPETRRDELANSINHKGKIVETSLPEARPELVYTKNNKGKTVESELPEIEHRKDQAVHSRNHKDKTITETSSQPTSFGEAPEKLSTPPCSKKQRTTETLLPQIYDSLGRIGQASSPMNSRVTRSQKQGFEACSGPDQTGNFFSVPIRPKDEPRDDDIPLCETPIAVTLRPQPISFHDVDTDMSDKAEAPDARTVLIVVGGCFTPDGHKVAAYISSKFHERVCRSGHTWRHVDQDMRRFYYDEFVKKYTCESGHEQEFKDTWNAACAKLYKDLLYKCRKKGTRPSFIPEDIWDAWQAIWAAERWQTYAATARSNRNTELAGPSTGSTKHTAGSRSIVEHTLDLEHELQRPPTCWEIFTKTHKSKDGTFIDPRSQALDAEISARVAQASAPAVEGGERQDLSTDQLNKIYYDVVGGRKKSSTLYGLGSQARVVYDRVMSPRAKGRPSGSSSTIEALQKENQELKDRLSVVEASLMEYHQWAQQMKEFMASMGPSPSLPRYMQDAETQDPNAPDQ